MLTTFILQIKIKLKLKEKARSQLLILQKKNVVVV